MLGEDFPSDAELEATIERAQRKIDEADDYCGPAELAPSNNDLAADLLVDLRALLRQRQAVPALLAEAEARGLRLAAEQAIYVGDNSREDMEARRIRDRILALIPSLPAEAPQ